VWLGRQTTFLPVQEAGIFEFLVSGTGEGPRPLTANQISAVVGTTATQTLILRNPFAEPVTLDLSVACDGDAQELQLPMERTTDLAVGPLGSCSISLAYTPKNLSGVKGAVTGHVKCSYSQDPVKFVLPVLGVAEVDTLGQLIEVQTPTRQRVERQLHLQLPGIARAGDCSQLLAQVQLDVESKSTAGVSPPAASVVRPHSPQCHSKNLFTVIAP
jgi:hypothetical protein